MDEVSKTSQNKDVGDTRRFSQDTLSNSQLFSEQVFASAQEGIIVLDRDFRYVAWNPFLEEFSGIKESEVLGKRPWDVFPFLAEIKFEALLQKALGGETLTTPDLKSPHPKTGVPQWSSARLSPLRDSTGTVVGILIMVRDMTERKLAEEENRKLEAQIQHAQRLESLGILAGGIAHDFNNLLIGVLGNADLALLDLPQQAEARHRLLDIKTAAIRASELTRQMLAYSGKGKFVVQTLNVNELILEIANLLQISISKQVLLQYNLSNLLPVIEGDASQIRQIVMNLITNASEAIGDKGGVITLTTGTVRADQNYFTDAVLDEKMPDGDYVFIEVSDNGCGMDAQTRVKIFDPFFSTKFTGRGLGLAAVLGIVRGHHGAIKVYSEPNRGTSFKLLFPRTNEPISSTTTTPSVMVDNWRGSGLALVADDEQTMRDVVKLTLERHGFRVITARDGVEALSIFNANANEIVIVILDMTMPRLGGQEVFRELRRSQPAVPVILSSGYNEQDATQHFVGKGLAGFIQKPFNIETLINKVREVLEAGSIK